MKVASKRPISISAGSTTTLLMAIAASLIFAGVSRAEATPELAPRQDVTKTPASTGAPAAPASTAPARGAREGIGVHGWWTIDVRNPDGSLDRHVEFENQLCTTFTDNVVSGLSVAGGDVTLASLLTSIGGSTALFPQAAASSGVWSIILGEPEPDSVTLGPPIIVTHAANCATTYTYALSNIGTMPPLNLLGAPLALNCGGTQQPPGTQCFPTLNVGMATPNHGGVLLSGQFTVPANAPTFTISSVGTDLFTCYGSIYCQGIPTYVADSALLSPPAPCTTTGSTNNVLTSQATTGVTCGTQSFSFSTYPVAGQPGRSPFSGVVLGTAGNPAPITVVGGQVVSITWSLTFL
jgi:hypothetical protein